MNWGYGMHACFGRFFASHLVKIILAHVILNYDMALKGPVSMRNIVIRSQRIGNPHLDIHLRRHGEAD